MKRLLLFLPAIALLQAADTVPKSSPEKAAPEGMVWIEGKTYTRGTKENPKLPFNPEERPRS